jgi:flavodoxin
VSADRRGAVIVFESIFGNTRAVADAIADGLGEAFASEVVSVGEADASRVAGADLLIVGGPTHMHGIASTMSRKMAVQGADDEGHEVDPSARQATSLRAWLSEQSGEGGRAATFDTRIDKSPAITGAAARGIAKRLRRRGFELIADPESFFVEDSEGPLADGELDRARAWGRALASA